MTLTPRLIQIGGALGVAFAVAGAVGYATSPQQVWVYTVLLLLSVLHLGVFFAGHFGRFKSFSSKRTTRLGANSVLMVLLFVAILAILNFIVARHPKRFDLSTSGAFTLSPQTIKVVKGMEDEVRFLAFFPELGDKTQAAREMLEAYRFQSRKVAYEIVDPDKNPQRAKQYNISAYETVVLESGKRTVTAKEATESGLTAALIRIGRDSQKTLYFVEGHGEHGIADDDRSGYSAMRQALEGQGFSVKPLLLLTGGGGVPDDAAVVVVGGPKRPFAPKETAALAAFLERGGRLLALIDPSTQTALEPLLLQWGVALSDDLIVDPTSGLGGTIPIIVPGGYPRHEITRQFDLATFYPAARSVAPADVAGLRFEPILETGKNSWRTTQTQGNIVLDPERDQPGPITLGASVQSSSAGKTSLEGADGESTDGDGGAKLVAIGDSDFATNAVAQSAGNGDLFQNVVGWLADEGDLVSIPPKEGQTSTLLISMQQGIALFLGSVVLLPLGILVSGLMVWRRRRRL